MKILDLDFEELWEKYSERIDTDIDSLQEFAGTDVITKGRFMQFIFDLKKRMDSSPSQTRPTEGGKA